MLCHRANHVSPTIVGNCLSCEERIEHACIMTYLGMIDRLACYVVLLKYAAFT